MDGIKQLRSLPTSQPCPESHLPQEAVGVHSHPLSATKQSNFRSPYFRGCQTQIDRFCFLGLDKKKELNVLKAIQMHFVLQKSCQRVGFS